MEAMDKLSAVCEVLRGNQKTGAARNDNQEKLIFSLNYVLTQFKLNAAK